jgi:hypothetical protein
MNDREASALNSKQTKVMEQIEKRLEETRK